MLLDNIGDNSAKIPDVLFSPHCNKDAKQIVFHKTNIHQFFYLVLFYLIRRELLIISIGKLETFH